MVLRRAITASISTTSGQTANNRPSACGAEGVTSTRSAPRKEIQLPPQRDATVGWRKEKIPIPKIIGAAVIIRRRFRRRNHRGHPGLQREGCSLLNSPLHAYPSRRHSETRQGNSSSLRHIRWKIPPQWNPGFLWPCPTRTIETGQSVRAPIVNSLSLDKMLNVVVTVV
jgi:hypothetical protein